MPGRPGWPTGTLDIPSGWGHILVIKGLYTMEGQPQNDRVLTEGASRVQPAQSPSTIRLGGFAEDLNTTIL
ncbi:MAG: hypothetical protein ACREFR_11675, partial [Limisphaerales bacterium]